MWRGGKDSRRGLKMKSNIEWNCETTILFFRKNHMQTGLSIKNFTLHYVVIDKWLVTTVQMCIFSSRRHFGLVEQWPPYEADPALTPVRVPLIAQGCRQSFWIMSLRTIATKSSLRESFYPASPHIYSNQSYCWGTHHWLNGLSLRFSLWSTFRCVLRFIGKFYFDSGVWSLCSFAFVLCATGKNLRMILWQQKQNSKMDCSCSQGVKCTRS